MRTIGLIAVAGMILGAVATLADERIPRDEIGISPLEHLNRLAVDKSIEFDRVKDQFGGEHPRAKAIERELQSIRRMQEQQLKKMPSWARRGVSEMNDAQLREMVGILVERVVRLEHEVQQLKKPKAAMIVPIEQQQP